MPLVAEAPDGTRHQLRYRDGSGIAYSMTTWRATGIGQLDSGCKGDFQGMLCRSEILSGAGRARIDGVLHRARNPPYADPPVLSCLHAAGGRELLWQVDDRNRDTWVVLGPAEGARLRELLPHRRLNLSTQTTICNTLK